jgi:hypothetical protein
MYSSALTTNSQKYGRTGCKLSDYYYETIQVNVVTTDWYSLSSNSSLDTYGCLYEDHFNPFNPLENLISLNDQSCGNNQFKLVAYLQSNTTYVLVVTTFLTNKTGQFSIFASGPNKVTLSHISEYLDFVNNQYRRKKYRKCL